MVNVDFMLGQRRRQLSYINPLLSISQRKYDRPTLAQCFPNVGPVAANNGPTLNQYWVSVSC